MDIPKISVIIPVKPGGNYKDCLDILKKVNYPAGKIEAFISYGICPSKQRNEAVKKAQGEILYFLDNDSEIESDAFKVAVGTFKLQNTQYKNYYLRGFSFLPSGISNFITNKFFSGKIYKGEIGAVGGPNIWRKNENFWATIAGFTLESFFIHFKMAARYRPIGLMHRASEKELILCNLAVRRDVFNKVGGFNEALYPNEENEFLNRVEDEGYQIIYHPGIIVFRPHRQTLVNLLKAFFYYGRGRMEQIKIEGVWQSLPVLMPVLLIAYLSVLLASIFIFGIYRELIMLFIPLFLYFVLALGSSLGYSRRKKKLYLLIILPLVFLLIHSSYGFGLLYGVRTDLIKKRIKAGKEPVEVIKIKSFNDKWK